MSANNKRLRVDPVAQFLDIEATVTNEEEEDDDEEEEEDELNHDDFVESQTPQYISWSRIADQHENSNEWDNFVDSLERRHTSRTTIVQTDDTPTNNDTLSSSKISSLVISIINKDRIKPTRTDYPLWRIQCKVGMEEEIVFILLQNATPDHDVKSAFTRGSIKGWVYLEAKMNQRLRDLIRHTPGIILVKSDLICQQIDFDDWLKTLKLPDPLTAMPTVGKWVRVLKGFYKGNVGCVLSVEHWGVRLLLVPQSKIQIPSNALNLKRKRRSYRIKHALFDIDDYDFVDENETGHANVFSLDGQIFDHGLTIQRYDFHSVSPPVHQMPNDIFCLFRVSQHPYVMEIMAEMPRPLEWVFSKGDQVVVASSEKRGVITALESTWVEIDLASGDGTTNIPWLDIRKVFSIGDYVEPTGGDHQGQRGWVSQVWRDIATVVKDVDAREPSLSDITTFDVRVNMLKLTQKPFLFDQQRSQSSKLPSDAIPWLNTEVVITKAGHPLKTCRGIVTNVSCGQVSPSGIILQVQLNSYNPTSPFKVINVDYDDVVEASLRRKLYDFKPTSVLFAPRNHVSGQVLSSVRCVDSTTLSGNIGYITLMTDFSPSSSPAWDPSSQSPLAVIPDVSDMDDDLAGPSQPSDLPVVQHLLLDQRLMHAPLKVIVTGGTLVNKQSVAQIVYDKEQLCIQIKSYRATFLVKPHWVTPRHPNPTRDNGLLIVIKGDHCGKYVRRIYHKYDDGKAFMLVAVVNREAGKRDVLTEETLQLDAFHLCLCDESKDDKTLNASLMDALREEARKNAAK